MIRRLVIMLAILLGLLALADRGLAVVAGNAVGVAVARTEGFSEEPDVTFRGFPFLTQAFRGEFEAVDVTARDVRLEGLTVTRIDAHVEGVRVGLSKALSGEIRAVPIDRGEATVTLSYADLNQYLQSRPGDPRVSASGDRLLVRTDVAIPNQGTVTAQGTARVTVEAGALHVRVTDVRTVDGAALPTAARAEALRRLSFDLALGTLPFGIELRSVRVTAEALVLNATAAGVVIRT